VGSKSYLRTHIEHRAAVPSTDDLTDYAYDNARRVTTLTLPGDIVLSQVRDGVDPAHPQRKGRLRAVSSPNSGNGTAPVSVSFDYADEVICADPNNPGSCPPAGPPGQLRNAVRGDVTTHFTWDGSIPVRETHTIAPGSATGLANTEYGITLNTSFLPQADQIISGTTTLSARYAYDKDTVLSCAGVGATCSASSGVTYLFDTGVGDSQPSGHGLLESTSSGSVAESFSYNSFGELATQVVSVSGTPFITTTYHSAAAPRDALGRITTRSILRGGQTRSTTYGYDDKGQLLTVADDAEPTRTNVYDPNGNRVCTYSAPATNCEAPAVFDAQDH
jgi:YD repeat-containing protein